MFLMTSNGEIIIRVNFVTDCNFWMSGMFIIMNRISSEVMSLANEVGSNAIMTVIRSHFMHIRRCRSLVDV